LSKDGKQLPDVDMNFVTVAKNEPFDTLEDLSRKLKQKQETLTRGQNSIAEFWRDLLGRRKSYRPAFAELRELQTRYCRAQRDVFEETRRDYFMAEEVERKQGQKRWPNMRRLDWRVSDFVTLGSPLTYASILLVHGRTPGSADPSPARQQKPSRDEFYAQLSRQLEQAKRCEQNWPVNGELEYAMYRGELPTAPPRPFYENIDKKGVFYFYSGDPDANRIVLTSNCPFLLTRWTNLYFPSNGRVFYGDPISGPLGPVFGLGINDIPLNPQEIEPKRHWLLWQERFAHTQYWVADRTNWDVEEDTLVEEADTLKKRQTRPMHGGDHSGSGLCWSPSISRTKVPNGQRIRVIQIADNKEFNHAKRRRKL
jgi:hypothetical protein